MSALGDISSNLVRWYRRRLKYVVVTALNQGIGSFVAYAILVVAGGIFLRQALGLRSDDQERLNQFMESAHLARDDEAYVSTTGLVLSELRANQRISSETCPTGSEECRVARDLMDMTLSLADLMQKPSEIDQQLGVILNAHGLEDDSLKSISAALSQGAPQFEIDCPYRWYDAAEMRQHATRRKILELMPARCVRRSGDLSVLQIPEQVSGSRVSEDARVDRAVKNSYALEGALRAYSSRLKVLTDQRCDGRAPLKKCNASSPETRRFTAAYFISIDSVFRIWIAESSDPMRELPLRRLWAARAYFTHFMKDETPLDVPYVSPPYIDYAGAGVVQTLCRAVTVPGEAAAPSRMLAGVVCVDLALNEPQVRELAKSLDSGPLVAAFLLAMNSECAVDPSDADQPADLLAISNSTQWQAIMTRRCTTGEAWREVTPIKLDSRTWYLIPIGSSGDRHLLIALTPTASSGIGRLLRWLFLGAMASAILVLLTSTAWQSKKLSLAERELARLRGLPTAALETHRSNESASDDELDRIAFANDRAEELLQVQLQRFGLRGGGQVGFWTVFEPKSILHAEPSGDIRPRRATSGQELRRELKEERARGEVTSYYVRFIRPRTLLFAEDVGTREVSWVRVTAGPVVLPKWKPHRRDARGYLEATFGVVVPILDEEFEKKLNAEEKKCAPCEPGSPS